MSNYHNSHDTKLRQILLTRTQSPRDVVIFNINGEMLKTMKTVEN